MAISLVKGANVSLSREEPGLNALVVGLGWDARSSHGDEFDLDASVFLLTEDGKVRAETDFIFYNYLKAADGSVEHTGDNRTGDGDGDDESIRVDLSRVPADVQKLAVVATIHLAEERRQNFGMVQNAFIRVVNATNDREIVRYDLSEDFSVETALIFGEIYRHSGDWKFRAVGQGHQGGLLHIARGFGVNL